MVPSTDSDTLIVGGGLAGMALAGYLRRQGRSPLIVEQTAEWRDTGYGIGLWEDGLAVCSELGCLDSVREQAADPSRFAVRAANGRLLTETSLPPTETLLLAIYRDDLHAALRESVPSEWVRMGTEPTEIVEHADGVAVTFEDGTTEGFDLVVGADGVHSTVRQACFTDWTKREHDTYIWSLWVPGELDIGADMVSVWGPACEGFLARVGDRLGLNFATRLDTPPEPPARDVLRERVADIGWRLPELLDSTDETPFFDRVRSVSCESWHTDRVVLVGDAAHAIHPISGMGASLALQDARVLAQELATGQPQSPATALDRFEPQQRAAAKRVEREARFEAALTFLESERLRRLRNGVVERTPLFEWFIQRQTTSG